MIGSILANMIVCLYNFLYKPGDLSQIFVEFNDLIWSIYNDGWFQVVMIGTQSIGVGLLAVACVIGLMDKVSEGDFSPNVLYRHLLKFVGLYILLINILDVFKYLLKISTALFDDLSMTISTYGFGGGSEALTELNKTYLARGIDDDIGVVVQIGIFIIVTVPFVVSQVFYVVMYFFAVSRLFEIIIRLACAPIAVGVSFFGRGANMDIVRFTKRTAGVFFQIVVILGITATSSFINSAIMQNSVDLSDPVSLLEYDDDPKQIEASYGEWVTISGDEDESVKSYTGESIQKFITSTFDISNIFLLVAMMISCLLLVVKSRSVSTGLF